MKTKTNLVGIRLKNKQGAIVVDYVKKDKVVEYINMLNRKGYEVVSTEEGLQ